MALEVERSVGEGITLPYAPIFDGVRNNRGFLDVRGNSELASRIAEGSDSPALAECLGRISRENAYFSLGCDLGSHSEPEQSAAVREVAGGYIQVTSISYAAVTTKQLDDFGEAFVRKLKALSVHHSWRIWLDGTWVNYRLPGEPVVTAPSQWIWFFARARTAKKAISEREVLIRALTDSLHSPRVLDALRGSSGSAAR